MEDGDESVRCALRRSLHQPEELKSTRLRTQKI
jgi:hypothetical protein